MRPLYWQEIEIREYSFNESGDKVEYYNKVNKAIRSDNSLVDMVWLAQSLSNDKKTVDLYIEIVAGQRLPPKTDPAQIDINGFPINVNIKRFSKKVTHKQAESLDIPEAIEWINNLKPE